MKWLLLIFSHLLLSALAGVMGHTFGLWAVWPFIFAPFLVYHSLYRPLPSTLLWALLLGYLTERLTLAPSGFYMVLFAFAIALIHFGITVSNMPEPLTLAIFAILFQLLVMLGGKLLLAICDLQAVYPTIASALIFPELGLAALFTLLLWPWYRFIYRPGEKGYNNVLIG